MQPTTKSKINRFGYKLTTWMCDLPPGEYTVYEIVEKTGQSYTNVYFRLNALQVKKFKRGRFYIYMWKGPRQYIESTEQKHKIEIRRLKDRAGLTAETV